MTEQTLLFTSFITSIIFFFKVLSLCTYTSYRYLLFLPLFLFMPTKLFLFKSVSQSWHSSTGKTNEKLNFDGWIYRWLYKRINRTTIIITIQTLTPTWTRTPPCPLPALLSPLCRVWCDQQRWRLASLWK